MAVTVEVMPLASLVDLVNEFGTVPREVAGEQDHAFPPADGLRLGIPDELTRDLQDGSLQRVADEVYPVFSATAPYECARQVTKLLAASRVSPLMTLVDDQLTATWSTDAPDQAVVAAAALAFRDHLGKNGFGRLGVCTAPNCADVFIDASPTRDRRYCSVTCQSRVRAAAFRSRRARTA
ncbi:CGNR zinc finger domain-containing protein [Actinomadura sp. WMMA1423]|uniref:CGNR zinc finger domain-containing protein n=1 Tax=Actinomadura sp. WMMA1423 TaxID=2591108 RepID=UPI00197AD301|nr:CGNR zinc finger domain-containing protein [Actinomadura sp. WMMA1423]